MPPVQHAVQHVAFTTRQHAIWEAVSASLARETDIAHDRDHVLRVYRWAVSLAAEEGVDRELAGTAALLHDLVSVPKESPLRDQSSRLSAAAGATLLPEAGYTPEETAAVVEAIRTCSWSRGQSPTSRLGAILQDADRLDAIGAIGIARNLMCAQAMAARGTGGKLYDPMDPFAEGRPLDDRRYAIDHYAVKLLRLADGMHTDAARQEAMRRHRFMCAFLAQLGAELHAGLSGPPESTARSR